MDFNKHVFHIFSENAYERKEKLLKVNYQSQIKIKLK